MFENSRARIPVRPLPYSDKDLAMTRELVIDYEKGWIFITDKDDPTVLIDITKLIAESYLSNINGDNTTVTINGEVYNLSKLLTDLKNNKIEILNTMDSTAIPADVKFDTVSVTVKNNLVEVYGFSDAEEESRPVKRNGVIVWEDPEGSGDPSEPTPGAKINVIEIMPTNNVIILYNKPYMYSNMKTTLKDGYLVHLPFSKPMYSKIKWKVDTEVDLALSFPSNILWINDKLIGTPVIKTITADNSYLLELETWDFGVTWIATQSMMFPMVKETLPGGNVYVVDDKGAFLTDENGSYLVTGETIDNIVTYRNNAVVNTEESIVPRIDNTSTGIFYVRKLTDLDIAAVIQDSDKIFVNNQGIPKQAQTEVINIENHGLMLVRLENDDVVSEPIEDGSKGVY